MSAEAYPLYWPPGFKRSKRPSSSRFRVTLNGAIAGLQDELRRLGNDTGKPVSDMLVSSNVTLMDQRPKDAGVSVWFTWNDMPVCFPCDRYTKVEDNLRAISMIIESHRTILRHGGMQILEATFRGFSALPPPRAADGTITGPRPWRQVMGIAPNAAITADGLRAKWREIVKTKHPDTGGNAAAFNEAHDAYKAGLEEIADHG